MTSKRDLKRRVRERQKRTGERYTTALGHVKGQRPASIPVVEMVDLTEHAARLGLRCRILMSPDLTEACGVLAVEKLRDALHATQDDPATRHFRAVALAGERRVPDRCSPREILAEGGRFMARARAGIGGVSPDGSMIAFQVAAGRGIETVVCTLWMMTVPTAPAAQPAMPIPLSNPWDRDPMIILTTPGGIQRLFHLELEDQLIVAGR